MSHLQLSPVDTTIALLIVFAYVVLAVAGSIVLALVGFMFLNSRHVESVEIPIEHDLVSEGIVFEFKREPIPVDLAERQAAFYRHLSE